MAAAGCATGRAPSIPAADTAPAAEAPPPVELCRELEPLPSGVCSASGGGEALLLRGTVLAPDRVLTGGEVLISPSGTILAVGCDTSQAAAGLDLSIVECPRGVISPGLINSHDHISYDQNAPGHWGEERYDHRHQWRKGLDGHTQIIAPRAADDLQIAWAELRQVFAGTTSIAGGGGHPGFLRNLDVAKLQEGLSAGAILYNTFPLGDANGLMLSSGCAYPKIDDTSVLEKQAYLPHVGEGVTAAARNEFLCMSGQQPGGRHLLASNGDFIHMLGTVAADVEALAKSGAAVVWSPRSNIALYGNTLAPRLFAAFRVGLSLASDWTPSGSIHLLRELRCAADFNSAYLDGFLSDRDLWHMVTGAPADGLGLTEKIGRLSPGRVADIAIFDGAEAPNPHRAVVDAGVEDVVLVLRGGTPLYGDADLMAALPKQQGCETLPEPVCGVSKSACVQRETGLPFAVLAKANTTSYGLFFCGTPPGEPTCIPSRPGEYTGQPAEDDLDGDGVEDVQDNCRRVFNPVRPLDAGSQADGDGDGIGDACDPCPLGGCA